MKSPEDPGQEFETLLDLWRKRDSLEGFSERNNNNATKTKKSSADSGEHPETAESHQKADGFPLLRTCKRPYRFKSSTERWAMTRLENFRRRIRFFVNNGVPNRLFGSEISDEFEKCYDANMDEMYDLVAREILFDALYDRRRCRLYVEVLRDVRTHMLGGSALFHALLKVVRDASGGKGTLISERMGRSDVREGLLLELRQEDEDFRDEMVVNSLCLLEELLQHGIISDVVDLKNFYHFYDNIGGRERLFALKIFRGLEVTLEEDRANSEPENLRDPENFDPEYSDPENTDDDWTS
uniref:MIF4G domain-containing protein n=1 Tax=Steinernema glaseri TaxID=37863 RepID=A0A1I7Z5H1_9BILA